MTAKKQRGSRSSYWIFVLPALVMVFFSSILPLLFNFYYALFDWNGVSATMNFIGLQNFETMVSDTRFLRSISFTCRYMCISVVLTNGISLGLSVALSHAGKKLSNFGRAAYYVPCITSSVATGLMWKVIFRDGVDTLHAFTHLDIFAKSWIGAVDMAFYSILIVGIWGSVGFYNIIYIAALKSVPADTLEAALIDGATYWQRFWRVTFP